MAALLEDEGFDVCEATSVAEGTARIEALPGVGVALLDINLGDGSGLDLIPLLRARHPAAKIVILSGDVTEREHGQADAWLAKGCEFDALLDSML